MQGSYADIIIDVAKQDAAVRSYGQRLFPRHRGLVFVTVFALGFVLYLLSVLPILIRHDGLFFYYGDYNVQQVPFYILAHRAVKNGDLLYHWNIDLGGNIVGNFAFYLMGSPFFWLTIPFREETVPYLMPYLMAIKSGVACLTAFVYIRRFLRPESEVYAVTGAMLFAFSGFQACNIVFQHFHDIVAFFPLLMLTFEDLMALHHLQEDEAGVIKFHRGGRTFALFALTVCLNAVTSYYFFYGEVVFLIIYFFVRYVPANGRRANLYMFFHALFGGLTGLALGAFFLMQAYTGVSGNDRLSNVLTGYMTIVYPEAKIPFDLLKSMVMIPDIIGKGTIFYTDTVKNSSLAVYLPLFGLSGVIAYFLAGKRRREDAEGRDYKKTLMIVCGVITLVPFFNAAFSLFNSQYYCRWFFMPILVMSLMTAQVLEDTGVRALQRGAIATTVLFLFMVGVACIPSTDWEGNLRYFNMSENPEFFEHQVIGTGVISIMLLFVAFLLPRYLRQYRGVLTLFMTMAAVWIMNYVVLYNGASLISDVGMEYWKNQMLDEKVTVDDSVFSRAETDSTSTNYEMVWGIPTIHCFLSTVPAEIFDFYEGTAGITRTVESDPPLDRKGLRAILSARYYMENALVNTEGEFIQGEGIVGYKFVDAQNGFDIYENENFIPMGFAYDHYISEWEYETLAKEDVDEALVKYLILSDDAIKEISGRADILRADAEEVSNFYSENAFEEEVVNRKETACTSFTPLRDGFVATTADLKKDSLLFFSVPLVEGISVTVDGAPVSAEKAFYGLMAVPVKAGVHEVRAVYEAPGLFAGIAISVTAFLALALYHLLDRKRNVKSKSDLDIIETAIDTDAIAQIMTESEDSRWQA